MSLNNTYELGPKVDKHYLHWAIWSLRVGIFLIITESPRTYTVHRRHALKAIALQQAVKMYTSYMNPKRKTYVYLYIYIHGSFHFLFHYPHVTPTNP